MVSVPDFLSLGQGTLAQGAVLASLQLCPSLPVGSRQASGTRVTVGNRCSGQGIPKGLAGPPGSRRETGGAWPGHQRGLRLRSKLRTGRLGRGQHLESLRPGAPGRMGVGPAAPFHLERLQVSFTKATPGTDREARRIGTGAQAPAGGWTFLWPLLLSLLIFPRWRLGLSSELAPFVTGGAVQTTNRGSATRQAV